MFSTLQLARKYIRYYFSASNGKGHGIHSPFVFDFVQHVLNNSEQFRAYKVVETLRYQMKHDNRVLDVQDMGAGSVKSASRKRKVSDIARHAVKPKKFGQLLFRIVNYYQPQTILELGTSLGITTSYLALANPNALVVSAEGATEVASIARSNFQTLAIKNVELREGNFDLTLPSALESFSALDFAFVDGNHRREPTMSYFQTLLGKINRGSIIIFDDIHWSSEMEEAWELIKAHPAVTLSIDLFFIGLVFFREEFKIKQHFVVKF